MIVSRALGWACLTFLCCALAAVAALLVVLVIVQHLRGDEAAQPLIHLAAGAVSLALAWLCHVLAKRLIG